MTFELRLTRGQQHSSDQPGSNSDERLFLRELSSQISEAPAQSELLALTRESDPELLGASLRSFAGRQENRGRNEIAAAIYARMAEAPAAYGAAESRLAGERLAALRGQGSFGAKTEIFVRSFAQSVTDPANLAGMALAGGVFQSLRLASYAGLLASPAAGIATRGIGARGLSWGLALLAEAPAFSLGVRSVNAVMGRSQDWSARALGHELAASYLTLGALRLSGAGGDLLFRRLNPAGGLMSRGFVQQASMFTGITAAGWLEQQTGLRDPTDGASLLASSLASLIHFNVAGRILHGLPGGNWTQRLRLQQERLENLPPPSLEAVRAWTLPGRTPVLAGPDTVFMSGVDGAPSTPPPPMASGGEIRSARPSTMPPPARDIKADLTEIERSISSLYDNRVPGFAWTAEALAVSRLYGQVLETVRYGEKRTATPREEILNHLKDLTNEADIVSRLLSTAELAVSNGAEPRFPAKDISVLSAERHLVGQFMEHFYRSANNFINFLDNTATIPEPLQNLRIARYWLQHGVERATLGEPIPVEHPSDFPYQRGEDGYYTIPGSGKHIIIVGDERGPRTFDMLNSGNQVTHVEFDNSRMKITQRLMEMKVQRAKDSGQWRLELPDGAQFRSRISEAEPADYVEAYFPILFDALKPRGDSRRMEQLRELIVTNLAVKLNPEGSVFVISNRHDAVEDLARAVQHFPNLDLLEMQIIRDRMPLRAGMHVTAVQGEHLYSWLVFRNRGE